MKTVLKLSILTVALAVAGVTTAEAKRGMGGMHDVDFETLDSNGDGKITKAELEARGAARFAKLDTDGDAAVSAAELEAHLQERAKDNAARMMEKLDADGDGKLTQAEMESRRHRGGGRMFSRMDANDDGAISKEEFDAAKAKFSERRKKWHKN